MDILVTWQVPREQGIEMDFSLTPGGAPLACLLMCVATFPAPAEATGATHYLTLINDDDRSVTAVEARPAGDRAFQPLDIGDPLGGGRAGQATVAMPAGPCRWDLRVVYRDNALLTITGWNVCRQPVLRFGAARQAALRQRHSA
jgi:hypothetical protein